MCSWLARTVTAWRAQGRGGEMQLVSRIATPAETVQSCHLYGAGWYRSPWSERPEAQVAELAGASSRAAGSWR